MILETSNLKIGTGVFIYTPPLKKKGTEHPPPLPILYLLTILKARSKRTALLNLKSIFSTLKAEKRKSKMCKSYLSLFADLKMNKL